MLELRNINTSYGNIQVLHDISLRVEQGEIITLIGANGAGKSTILMSICGIVPPVSGEIFFKGACISRMPPDKIVASGLSQVPEGRHIFPELTVAE
ncbi:MAG: ATP-binding cassette domain-containing protein, partial [Candidatus Electrothrix sp. AUS1_2]|nr:ATP-binding cassette domain-containing protein [Candidatus Electrothrix sp. AUS1_2]